MRTPWLVAIVVLMHVFAVGGVLFIQGCGTTRTVEVEAPPPPIMPPSSSAVPSAMDPAPVFRPPRPAPSSTTQIDMPQQQTHIIKKGETLSGIAKRYKVSYKELAELNGIKNPDRIQVGQTLTLPVYAGSAPPPKRAPVASRPASAAVSVPAGGTTYTVQSGDYLGKIAGQYGTTVKAIKAANNLSSDRIYVDQKLVIPGGASRPAPAARKPEPKPAPKPTPKVEKAPEPEPAPAPAVKAAPVTPPPTPAPEPVSATAEYSEKPFPYQVGEDETLSDIAKAFVVSTNDIIQLNNLQQPVVLTPGQTINIPPSY